MARIAFVLADDFEDSEFTDPRDALTDAGHDVVVVATSTDSLTGKSAGTNVDPDTKVTDVRVDDFDALVVPGGYSPDHLRTDADVVAFVRGFFEADKPVAAICHAGSLLVEADVVRGRRMTSWPSIRTDLRNAGAEVVDEEVVVDGRLVTSRQPDDLPAFCSTLLDLLPAPVVTGGG